MSDTLVSITQNEKTYSVQTGLFINNQFVPSISGKKFETVNPANGKVICSVYEADAADVDVAVAAAKEAFKTWKNLASAARGVLIYKLADLMERDRVELAELESIDNGKPATVANAVDVNASISHLRYFAGWADKIHGKTMDISPSVHCYTKHEPFGVCGQIIPWNFPLLMLAWKFGPALATGNTIVLKTSEKTPLSALKVAQLVVEAGFPAGVINIISGFGPTAGNALAQHMDVKKIAFTGSTPVGRKIMEASAQTNLKKVSLELGGKSPNIVFADANIDEAVKWSHMGIFFNHGQTCCAGSRLFVQEEIYDVFVQKFEAMTAEMKIGDPSKAETSLGPLVDIIQFDRVMGYIQKGKQGGATCKMGGERHGEEGFFVKPTIFSDVTDDMVIAKEEIFGPVVVIMKFKTLEEVIERANDTPYGLAAAVHTSNHNTAIKVSNALEAGTVWINCYNMFFNQNPFGGYKTSGLGRELGEYALSEYTQVKSVQTLLQ
jgi:aldehyde dehydrogenase (NAD+)